MTSNSVVTALKASKKGQLKYDYYWEQEGRTPAMLDEITAHITRLSISPKALEAVQENELARLYEQNSFTSDDSISSSKATDEENSPVREIEDKWDPHIIAALAETELALRDYDKERRKTVLAVFERKRTDMENKTKELQRQSEQQFQLIKRKKKLESMRKDAEIQQLQEKCLEVAREKELQERERRSTQARRKSAIIKEVEMKQQQAEEQQQRWEKEQLERKQQLIACQTELHSCTACTKQTLDSCQYKKYLEVPCEERYKQIDNVLSAIKDVVEELYTRDVGIEDLIKAQQLFDNARMIYDSVNKDIEQAQNKGLIEAEKMKIQQRNLVSIPNSRDHSRQVSGSSVKHSNEMTGASDMTVEEMGTSDEKKASEDDDLPIYHCITHDVLKEYSSVMDSWENWNKDCQPFTSDTKNKTYMFNVRKAVTTPINTISGQSGSHIRDKLGRLMAFLSGQPVEVTGKRISCKEHPLALTYSKGIIAQQFVSQGEGQIASQFSSAFPFAATLVGLLANYPDMRPLILAVFYKRCPYLAPYYPPQEENQSDMDYYKSLGYKYDGETIEKQDKFLKRMSGFMRLYAAIIQSPLPPGCKGPHPHGVERGWRWLAHILNLNPRPDITATLLFDFLEVCGHTLQKTYGNQFQKILHVLCKDYFPKIEHVTPAGSGGPLTRLKDFLHNAIKKRVISPPDGVLSASFFYS